jgi:hypothetical protein
MAVGLRRQRLIACERLFDRSDAPPLLRALRVNVVGDRDHVVGHSRPPITRQAVLSSAQAEVDSNAGIVWLIVEQRFGWNVAGDNDPLCTKQTEFFGKPPPCRATIDWLTTSGTLSKSSDLSPFPRCAGPAVRPTEWKSRNVIVVVAHALLLCRRVL